MLIVKNFIFTNIDLKIDLIIVNVINDIFHSSILLHYSFFFFFELSLPKNLNIMKQLFVN